MGESSPVFADSAATLTAYEPQEPIMPGKHVHVVSAGDRWAVVADGGHGRETFRTLEDAIAAGAKEAQQRHVELLIHGRDGHVKQRSNFSDA